MFPGRFLPYEKTSPCIPTKVKLEIAWQRGVNFHLPALFVQCSYSLMSSNTRNLILWPASRCSVVFSIVTWLHLVCTCAGTHPSLFTTVAASLEPCLCIVPHPHPHPVRCASCCSSVARGNCVCRSGSLPCRSVKRRRSFGTWPPWCCRGSRVLVTSCTGKIWRSSTRGKRCLSCTWSGCVLLCG